jgi:hypothetical protein
MKIALGFWGLTRSLKFTIESIKANIFDVLHTNDISFTTFVHTYEFKSAYVNKRANEANINLDFDEYNLLTPDFVKRDDQDLIQKQLNMAQYRSHKDPWQTNYATVDNFILAMYSRYTLGKVIEESGKLFDYIIFLRPDVKYLNPLDTTIFQRIKSTDICIANFHLGFKINDRFFIITSNNLKKFCGIFNDMLLYSKHNQLHSETFHYDILVKMKFTLVYLDFFFQRVRANGEIAINDISLNKSVKSKFRSKFFSKIFTRYTFR